MTIVLDETISLFVPGLPRPQGSMRGFKMGDRVRIVHAKTEDLAVWRGAVTQAAVEHWGDVAPLDEAVWLSTTFYLPRPRSAPRARLYPDRLPDIDKLARAVLDSLTGVVFVDDARVVDLVVSKRYATDLPQGARIIVGRLT